MDEFLLLFLEGFVIASEAKQSTLVYEGEAGLLRRKCSSQ